MATEIPLAELQQLEDTVRRSEGDGLRARHQSGRLMLPFKKGKQLPKGMLNDLVKKLGACRLELGRRMTFAAQYTEAELSTAVESGKSWTEVRKALTTKSRKPKAPTQDACDDTAARDRKEFVRGIVESIRDLETRSPDETDIAQLQRAIQHLAKSVCAQTKAAA
jgi:hypothetical protein